MSISLHKEIKLSNKKIIPKSRSKN